MSCSALQVVRNVVFEPRLLPGGGATEMAVSAALSKKAQVRPGCNPLQLVSNNVCSAL